jgi:hypothetical protein
MTGVLVRRVEVREMALSLRRLLTTPRYTLVQHDSMPTHTLSPGPHAMLCARHAAEIKFAFQLQHCRTDLAWKKRGTTPVAWR